MQKDHSFPGKHAHGPPTLLCTKKQFYPTKMQNLPALIWTNLLKTTWLSLLGIPSNAVIILYNNNVCYFLKLPKFPPPVLIFLELVSFASSVYTDNIHNSLLMAIQKVYLICVLLLISVFFILCHSRFILLGGVRGGGGVGGVSQLIWFWDTRGSHPKKFVIKRGVFMYYMSYLLTSTSYAFPIRNERSLIKTLYRSCE